MNRKKVNDKIFKYIEDLSKLEQTDISLKIRTQSGCLTVYLTLPKKFKPDLLSEIRDFFRILEIEEKIKADVNDFRVMYSGHIVITLISQSLADKNYEMHTRDSMRLGFPDNVVGLDFDCMGESCHIIDVVLTNKAFPILIRNKDGTTFATTYEGARLGLDDKYIMRMSNLRNILKE